MKKLIVLVAVLALVAFVSGAMAQQKPAAAPEKAATTAPAAAPKAEKAKMEKFSGTIEKVDEMAKAIDVKGKTKSMTFGTDDKTKITKSGKDMPFGDLKKGVSISVEYKKDGDKMVATAIKAAAPKAAPKAAAPKEEPKKEEPKK